jgi:hypothetical protein
MSVLRRWIEMRVGRKGGIRSVMAVLALLAILMSGMSVSVSDASAANGSVCQIPKGGDQDSNGIGDVGVEVVCNYDSYYAVDGSGAYYWDLGDGRVYTSPGVTDPTDLDAATLDECFYRIHTRGTFNNDPFQDSGQISNMIRCTGASGTASYSYQIVHQSDPRFTGNPDFAIWGTWEYHVLTESGSGNLVHRLSGPQN